MSLVATDTAQAGWVADGTLDGIMDSLPADATQDQINRAIIKTIARDVFKAKKLETVARRWAKHMNLLEILARTDPAAFAAVTLEFAKRFASHPAHHAGHIPTLNLGDMEC